MPAVQLSSTAAPEAAPTTPTFTPFLLLTPRLLLLPTPLAITQPPYTTLYASLHADPAFCAMAFGTGPSSFHPVDWSTDNKVIEVIAKEVRTSWDVRGMGDFAVGLIPEAGGGEALTTSMLAGYLERSKELGRGEYLVIGGEDCERIVREDLHAVRWIGYAGVRDATTTSMPKYATTHARASDDLRQRWQDLIEIRYGFHASAWGKGYGSEAARGVMAWCERERGARGFISECEIDNRGSAAVLRKLGFVERGDKAFWGMEGTVEWERRVGAE